MEKPKENLNQLQEKKGHQEYSNSAEDNVERAFFDLQDAKTNFFAEKADFNNKMKAHQQKTFTSGFFNARNGVDTATGQPILTQDQQTCGTNSMLATGTIPAPNMTTTSFYNRRTTTSSQA